MSRAISLAHAVLVIPTMLAAQRPQCPPRAAGDTTVVAPNEADQPPVADTTNAPPGYPQLLEQAGVGGFVRVIFTVDTAGVPERTTIAIVRSPNPGFDFGIKRAVSTWRYVPARLCGRPVRVRRRHEFEFRPITRRGDTLRLDWLFADSIGVPTTAASFDTLPDGTPHTIVAVRSVSATPPVFSDFNALDSAARDSAEEAALAVLVDAIAAAKDSLARIVCISGKRGLHFDPDRGRLIRLTRPRVAVLPFRRCPQTFSSMLYVRGRRPELPGGDPYHIRFMTKRALSPTQVLFDIDVAQGTGGTRYRCGAGRRSTGWRARCFVVSSWMS